MSLVVDSSVVLKWVLPDEADAAAEAVALSTEALVAPDFLAIECANVLAQAARARRISQTQALDGLREILAGRVLLEPSLRLVPHAQELAMELRQSVYDSLYLALAMSEGITLVTADARFATAAAANPAYDPHVRRL